MYTIGTLLVRDEEEIVKQCIDHHLANGIDAFIVTDNGSKDNTRQIVAACPGVIELIDEPEHNHHQSKWVSRMARHAYRYNADWIVHIDADEFWYGLNTLNSPRFKNTGVITVTREYHHVAVDGLVFGNFIRSQMPYYRKVRHPMPKVIHRVAVNPHISHGNHLISGVPGHHIPAPKDFYIHHYPVRSYEHFEAKTIKGGTALRKHPGSVSNGKRWRDWYKQYKQGKLYDLYLEKHLYTQDKILQQLEEKSLHTLHET